MIGDISTIVDETVASLREALGPNLFSCCLYGSAVRGNVIEGKSDINLLIILNQSTVEAHQAIAAVLAKRSQIDPFVLGKPGFKRSVRAFAAKFSSIRRTYRVLHGADPFADVEIPPELERFLCEQALRNLRLRLVYAFVTHQRHAGYERFLVRCVTPLFLRLSETARLSGAEFGADFEARIPILEKQFGIEGSVLRDVLPLRHNPGHFSENECTRWHRCLLSVLDVAITWIENNWPDAGLSMPA